MENKQVKITGWVARNDTGKLIWHENMPSRTAESRMTDVELMKENKWRVHYPKMWISEGAQLPLNKIFEDQSIFDDLKWEDEPIESEIIINIKQK